MAEAMRFDGDGRDHNQETRTPDATAVPMRAGEERALQPAESTAIGEAVRQMSDVVTALGRTIEAQSQRSNRLLERFEQLTEVLSVLPEESDRNLEALDAIQRAIQRQQLPVAQLTNALDGLRGDLQETVPGMAQTVHQNNESARHQWQKATEELAGRVAHISMQAEARAQQRQAQVEERIRAQQAAAEQRYQMRQQQAEERLRRDLAAAEARRKREREEVAAREAAQRATKQAAVHAAAKRRRRTGLAAAAGIAAVVGAGVFGPPEVRGPIDQAVGAIMGSDGVEAQRGERGWRPVEVRQADAAEQGNADEPAEEPTEGTATEAATATESEVGHAEQIEAETEAAEAAAATEGEDGYDPFDWGRYEESTDAEATDAVPAGE